jgi:hypothetical protein
MQCSNNGTGSGTPMPIKPRCHQQLIGRHNQENQHVLAWQKTLEASGIALSVWSIHRRMA